MDAAHFTAARLPWGGASPLPALGILHPCCDCRSTGAGRAGLDGWAYRREEIMLRNRAEQIAIRIIEDVESLSLGP